MELNIKFGRRKSFDIEHVEATDENLSLIAQWSRGSLKEHEGTKYVQLIDKNAMNARQARVFVGDIVVRHTELNTFKSFGKKAFAKSYEDVVIRHIARDASSGEIITQQEASENPKGTTVETVEIPRDAGLS